MTEEDWTTKPERYRGMNAGPHPVWDDDGGAWVKVDPELTENPRSLLLQEAERLVNGDRNNTYGPPTQDFQRAATIATALGYTGPGGRELLPHDIALLVMAVKMSRLTWSPEKRDSWVDIAGYAACGFECVAEVYEDVL